MRRYGERLLSPLELSGGAALAWAALAGWLILPPHFHGGAIEVPPLERFPPPCQRLIREFRLTRAGKHVVHCYERYRC